MHLRIAASVVRLQNNQSSLEDLVTASVHLVVHLPTGLSRIAEELRKARRLQIFGGGQASIVTRHQTLKVLAQQIGVRRQSVLDFLQSAQSAQRRRCAGLKIIARIAARVENLQLLQTELAQNDDFGVQLRTQTENNGLGVRDQIAQACGRIGGRQLAALFVRVLQGIETRFDAPVESVDALLDGCQGSGTAFAIGVEWLRHEGSIGQLGVSR